MPPDIPEHRERRAVDDQAEQFKPLFRVSQAFFLWEPRRGGTAIASRREPTPPKYRLKRPGAAPTNLNFLSDKAAQGAMER